jgi:sphingolipid delta-4 desaturase
MNAAGNGYFQSGLDQPHPERTRQILREHPEERRLFGRNPWTAAILLLVVSLQSALAWGFGILGLEYWWLALIVAWCVGAFANHTLYVIIHEATHSLIFKSPVLNRWTSIIADLPNIFPAAAGFRVYHLKHHAHQGDYDFDADLASRWEARLIGNSILGKVVWELFFPFFQLCRPPRLRAIKMWSRWSWANVIAGLAYDALILIFCGWAGLVYLLASFFFSVGFHPVGARWVQEHYTLDPVQETFSYYGPLNLLALNVGYHNEHHDFPYIPWNRLPQLKALAPEFYDTLKSHRSWCRLWIEFLLNPQYSLFRRVERVQAGKVALQRTQPPAPEMAIQ